MVVCRKETRNNSCNKGFKHFRAQCFDSTACPSHYRNWGDLETVVSILIAALSKNRQDVSTLEVQQDFSRSHGTPWIMSSVKRKIKFRIITSWRNLKKTFLMLYLELWVDMEDDVIKWQHCPRCRRFVRGIVQSLVDSPNKALCAWKHGWANHRDDGDLRRHRAQYDVTEKASKAMTRFGSYRQISNISRTLVGNWIVDHSDVAGASPIGAAPTTPSFAT